VSRTLKGVMETHCAADDVTMSKDQVAHDTDELIEDPEDAEKLSYYSPSDEEVGEAEQK